MHPISLWRRGWESVFYPSSNYIWRRASQVAQMIKNLRAMRETRVLSQEGEDPMKKGMETHCTILAWRILPREKSGRLQSMESQRIGHD